MSSTHASTTITPDLTPENNCSWMDKSNSPQVRLQSPSRGNQRQPLVTTTTNPNHDNPRPISSANQLGVLKIAGNLYRQSRTHLPPHFTRPRECCVVSVVCVFACLFVCLFVCVGVVFYDYELWVQRSKIFFSDNDLTWPRWRTEKWVDLIMRLIAE